MGWRVSAIGQERDCCPPGSIRSSKRNTCFEKHAQWKYTWEVHFSIKHSAGKKREQSALQSRCTFTTLHGVTFQETAICNNQRHEGITPHFLLHFILCVYIPNYFTFFYLYTHFPVITYPSPYRIPLLLVFNIVILLWHFILLPLICPFLLFFLILFFFLLVLLLHLFRAGKFCFSSSLIILPLYPLSSQLVVSKFLHSSQLPVARGHNLWYLVNNWVYRETR